MIGSALTSFDCVASFFSFFSVVLFLVLTGTILIGILISFRYFSQ